MGANESTMNSGRILLDLPRRKPMIRHTMPPSKAWRTNLTARGRGRASSAIGSVGSCLQCLTLVSHIAPAGSEAAVR